MANEKNKKYYEIGSFDTGSPTQESIIADSDNSNNIIRNNLKYMFEETSLDEDHAYCYFHRMISTGNSAGVLRSDILSGCILFLKDKGLGNTSTTLYNSDRDLIFCIGNNKALFITSELMITCEDFHLPIFPITIKSEKLMGDKDKEFIYTDLGCKEWHFVISELASYVATLLVKQYKKSNMNKY